MSTSADPVALIEQVIAADVATFDAASVAEGCRTVARLRGVLDAFEAALLARSVELHAAGAGAAPVDVLTNHSHVSGRQARQAVARSEALTAIPLLGAALSEGSVSAGHTDALMRVAGRLDDRTKDALLAEGPLLVGVARRVSPEAFERQCKRLADSLGDGGLGEFERQRRQTRLRHWVDRESGMYMIRGELDPEIGAPLFTTLDTEVERLWHSDGGGAGVGLVGELSHDNEHLAAHALGTLVHRGHLSAAGDPVTSEVNVLIDHQTLQHGLHEHGVCERADGTPIPVETARRHACAAGIIPVVLGGDGIPLDAGRRRRLATRDQRRALRAMYRTCAFDGCDVPFQRCQPHHLLEWDVHEGTTDLQNLLPLCHRHHHLAHEGGWQLALDQHRTLAITRPDGTLHATVPLPSRARAA